VQISLFLPKRFPSYQKQALHKAAKIQQHSIINIKICENQNFMFFLKEKEKINMKN